LPGGPPPRSAAQGKRKPIFDEDEKEEEASSGFNPFSGNKAPPQSNIMSQTQFATTVI